MGCASLPTTLRSLSNTLTPAFAFSLCTVDHRACHPYLGLNDTEGDLSHLSPLSSFAPLRSRRRLVSISARLGVPACPPSSLEMEWVLLPPRATPLAQSTTTTPLTTATPLTPTSPPATSTPPLHFTPLTPMGVPPVLSPPLGPRCLWMRVRA